jgi:hypothetical protein
MSSALFSLTRLLFVTFLLCRVSNGAEIADLDLARMLANTETRQRAIQLIAAAPSTKLPLLIAWSLRPPAHMDEFNLRVGLMDAFGELKSKEAIPFLVKNISRQRTLVGDANIFMKTEESVESRVPAVAALIKIGPDCLPVLYGHYSTAPLEDRIATIIVVSRIAATMTDPSNPKGFLASVAGETNMIHSWAEDGLKHLNAPK